MTKEQLETRLDYIESLIAKERDPKNLPYLNDTFQKLLDRLVEIDLTEQEKGKTR